MNEYVTGFLNEDWAAVPQAPRIYLGAFGKHPGWDDHLDDIGLITGSLVAAKRILYAGISHQIEHAAWDKAGPERVGPDFHHLIHWRRPGESISGLIWSSQDGKGRSLYPMILLAHCVGQPFAWVAETVLPVLESTAAQCRETTSAAEVVALIGSAQEQLRREAPAVPVPRPSLAPGVPAWARFTQEESWLLPRVLHHLHHQFAIFAPTCRDWTEGGGAAQSRSLRLPQIPGAAPAESLSAWISFLRTQLDCGVPVLGMLALDGNWLDLVVGEPSPADFFVLRALPAAAPMVTEIPYQTDPELLASWSGIAAAAADGHLPETSLFNGKTMAANRAGAARWLARCRPGSGAGFLRRWFGGSGSSGK
jgi:hypothetical protein